MYFGSNRLTSTFLNGLILLNLRDAPRKCSVIISETLSYNDLKISTKKYKLSNAESG